MGTSPSVRAARPRCSSAGPASHASASGVRRLDPENIGAHRGRLLRAAWAMCGSRENAEDLVQDTVTKILSRPRLLRGDDEYVYLLQALRNTFLTSRTKAARRPRVVMTLEDLDAVGCTAARTDEAVITAQVFPAIAQLPESFRLALVAVDVAGLSYGEAARALGAPQATIATRLHRARRLVARQLDPERLGAPRSKENGNSCAHRSSRGDLSSNAVARSGRSRVQVPLDHRRVETRPASTAAGP